MALPEHAIAKIRAMNAAPKKPNRALVAAAAANKRKSNNPAGRPTDGLTEVAFILRGPALLLETAKAAAAAEGVPVTEWWRRAGRVRLGWREVV